MSAKMPKLLEINLLDIGESEDKKIMQFLFGKKHNPQPFGSQFQIIDCLRAGLPRYTVNNILDQTDIAKPQLSSIIHMSFNQLNRHAEQDMLSVHQSSFLYEFARVYVRTSDIFGDSATADSWLHRSNTALGGKTPIELLDTIEGFRMVEDLLLQIEYGAYS